MNTVVPQGHLHFYPNLKFGEMLAYFKPFRRRSSVFRQAENSRFSWGINNTADDPAAYQTQDLCALLTDALQITCCKE